MNLLLVNKWNYLLVLLLLFLLSFVCCCCLFWAGIMYYNHIKIYECNCLFLLLLFFVCCCCLFWAGIMYYNHTWRRWMPHEKSLLVHPTPVFLLTFLPHFSPTPHSLTSPYSTTLLGSVPILQLVITNIHTSNQTMKLSMCQICLWVSVYYGTFLKSGDERGEEGISRHTGSCSKPSLCLLLSNIPFMSHLLFIFVPIWSNNYSSTRHINPTLYTYHSPPLPPPTYTYNCASRRT